MDDPPQKKFKQPTKTTITNVRDYNERTRKLLQQQMIQQIRQRGTTIGNSTTTTGSCSIGTVGSSGAGGGVLLYTSTRSTPQTTTTTTTTRHTPSSSNITVVTNGTGSEIVTTNTNTTVTATPTTGSSKNHKYKRRMAVTSLNTTSVKRLFVIVIVGVIILWVVVVGVVNRSTSGTSGSSSSRYDLFEVWMVPKSHITTTVTTTTTTTITSHNNNNNNNVRLSITRNEMKSGKVEEEEESNIQPNTNYKTEIQKQPQPDSYRKDLYHHHQQQQKKKKKTYDDGIQRLGNIGPSSYGYVLDLLIRDRHHQPQLSNHSTTTIIIMLLLSQQIEMMTRSIQTRIRQSKQFNMTVGTNNVNNNLHSTFWHSTTSVGTNHEKDHVPNTTNSIIIQPCVYYKYNISQHHRHWNRLVPWIESECIISIPNTSTIIFYGYNSAPFARYYYDYNHSSSSSSCHRIGKEKETEIQYEISPGVVISLPSPMTSNDVCDTTPPAATTTTTNAAATTKVRVFPFDITHLEIQSTTPPIVIYDRSTTTRTTTTVNYNNKHTHQDQSVLKITTKTITCDVPCEYDITLHADIMNNHHHHPDEIIELGIVGTNWTMKQTFTDPYYNDNAKIERTDYLRDIYYSTLSLQSSVPLTYYNFDRYNLHNTKAMKYHTTRNAAATYLLNTNCGLGRRNKWIAAMQVVLKVDAYGSCHNNVPLLPHETIDTMEGRIQLMRKNRIVLAFEAGTDKDYITNIVWEALLSGSVPAILGASNLEQEHHLPPNAAIYASNFNSWDKFATYVANVANNETLWNSYHLWRTDRGAIQKFEQRYEYLKFAPSPECRICRWAYSKLYGVGFNHTTQMIQPTKISRNLCTTKKQHSFHNQAVTPFREIWYVTDQDVTDVTSIGSALDVIGCTLTTSSIDTIQVDGHKTGTNYNFQRNITELDGIIDIAITKIVNHDVVDGDLTMRLMVDKLRNSDGAHFRNVHNWITEAIRTPLMSSSAIQDEYSKVTVITNFITKIHSPAEGIIDVQITNGDTNIGDTYWEILRIRIISEDTDPIHDKVTEYVPSSYARRMMHDFIDPLEVYYAKSSVPTK